MVISRTSSVVLSNISMVGMGGEERGKHLASAVPLSFFFFSFCTRHLMKVAKSAWGSVYYPYPPADACLHWALILIEDAYFSGTGRVILTLAPLPLSSLNSSWDCLLADLPPQQKPRLIHCQKELFLLVLFWPLGELCFLFVVTEPMRSVHWETFASMCLIMRRLTTKCLHVQWANRMWILFPIIPSLFLFIKAVFLTPSVWPHLDVAIANTNFTLDVTSSTSLTRWNSAQVQHSPCGQHCLLPLRLLW